MLRQFQLLCFQWICVLCFFTINLNAQINYGDGRDGIMQVPAQDTLYIDSIRAEAIEQPDPNALRIDNSNYHKAGTTGFQAGDSVLIVQMIDSTNPDNRGRYQIRSVKRYRATNNLLVTENDIHYNSFSFNQSEGDRVQILELPQYEKFLIEKNANLTCHSWDGHTGGIVAFLVKDVLQFNYGGQVNVESKGFCNPNSGGEGGNGGQGGSGGKAPSITNNKGASGNSSRNGKGPPATAPGGQLLSGENRISGGCGGNGGIGYKGDSGKPGKKAGRYQVNHGNFLLIGQAGHGGRGGRGAQGGGGGGSGGNGYYQGEDGKDGQNGEKGGKGGAGGCGGGGIFIQACKVIEQNNKNAALWAKGGPGKPGEKGGKGGKGGAGGKGGKGACNSGKVYGAGGGGGYGKRGNGGNGGDAGMVGAEGKIIYQTNAFINISDNLFNFQKGKKASGGYGGSFVDTWASSGESLYFFPSQCELEASCPETSYKESTGMFCQDKFDPQCLCDSVYDKLKQTDSVVVKGDQKLIFIKNDPANNYRVDCKYCSSQSPSLICVEKFFDSDSDQHPTIKTFGCEVSSPSSCDCLFTDIADYLYSQNCQNPPCFNYTQQDTVIDFQIGKYYFTDTSGYLTNSPEETSFCEKAQACKSDPCDHISCNFISSSCYKDTVKSDGYATNCEQPLSDSTEYCCDCPLETGSVYDCPIAGAVGAKSDTPQTETTIPYSPTASDVPSDDPCKNNLQTFFTEADNYYESNGSGTSTINLPGDFTDLTNVTNIYESCWPCNGDMKDTTITYDPLSHKLKYANGNLVMYPQDASNGQEGFPDSVINICGKNPCQTPEDLDCLEQFFYEAKEYFDQNGGGELVLPEDFESPPGENITPISSDCLPCSIEEISHTLEYTTNYEWELVEENGTKKLQKVDKSTGEIVEGSTTNLCNVEPEPTRD